MGAKTLGRRFYLRDAESVASDLIGAVLIRRYKGDRRRARIVETEAYLGERDRAAHAFHGLTRRTAVLYGPGGFAYVYLVYGMHELLNVVVGVRGNPQAVLIRAAEPLDGWDADLSGPGKLTRALNITRAHNGQDLTGGDLYLQRDPEIAPEIRRGPRIGIDYAREWRDVPLRFLDPRSGALSAPLRPRQVPAASSRRRGPTSPAESPP
jgi:DNA-3-methyladenine glycosylase